jgi:lipoprotein NlpD
MVNCFTGSSTDIFSLTGSKTDVMTHPRCCFTLLTILLAATLVACSSQGKKWNPNDYTVKSGDTIYAIAWRYELDPEEFAAWNGITTSEFIKPGQRLHTRKPYNFDTTRDTKYESDISYASPWVKANKGDTLYSLSKRSGVSVEQLAQLNQLNEPYTIKPGQTIFLKPLKSTGGSSAATRHKKNKPTKKAVATDVIKPQQSNPQTIHWPGTVRWQKPVNGKIIKKFSRQRNDSKGIDIAGKYGDVIVASADGKVVYSGNGLISYGNLIIIKHNKTYLSAYAYNRKLLVKEGDMVKSGQKIAEMGRKDELSPRLHFEIRKNGKPVDPQKYLP